MIFLTILLRMIDKMYSMFAVLFNSFLNFYGQLIVKLVDSYELR